MMTDYVIEKGDIGIGVNKLQAYLNMMQEKGYIQTSNLQDGVFGNRTVAAVKGMAAVCKSSYEWNH